MPSDDLVSVVIPCYNHGRYLGQAIESAVGQTYKPIEVVVVDDGSTDDSAAVAARYPVRLVRQPNRGLPAASNAGIAAASGNLLVRLDADDRLAPSYVAETVAALNARPDAHFVYTQVAYFGSREGTYPVEDFNPETLAERNYVHASALMRRAAFEAVGGYRLDMTGLRCEDWDLWLTFAERGLRGVLVPRPLLHYRQHPGGSMVTIRLGSSRGLLKEVRIAARLQDHHPCLFAPRALLRRLGRLPGRLARRQASPRFAALLCGFYGVMLLRHGARALRHAAAR